MARKVNPTRLNLLNLKRELKTAQKGYKLLKDKRDGLVQKFMAVVHETKAVREEINRELPQAFVSYVRASTSVSRKTHEMAFLLPNVRTYLTVTTRSVMSVQVPEFSLKKEGNAFSYGVLETSGELDNAVSKLDSIFPSLMRLAYLEKTLENLTDEIERTRRRVSALEHVRIPELEHLIRFIGQRLEEQARDAVVSSMRIKAMIVEKEEILAVQSDTSLTA